MPYEIEVVERSQEDAAVVRARVPHDGIGAFIGTAFGEVMAAVGGHDGIVGPPFARYSLADESGFEVEAGFPVADPVTPTGRVEAATLPGGTVATLVHTGPYEGLGAAYAALEAWFEAGDYAPAGAPWESYLDGPEVAEPRTIVCWPCLRD
jgi:effector-binding domain-containing protein